jgi:glutathione S-transferase
MKLYYVPGSSSLSSHIVLLESGLPFEKVRVDESTKIMEEGSDYKTINPLGYVPSLQLDDGTVVTEAPAILQFIADEVPAKKLAPPNATIGRTKLQSWLNFLSSELHKGGFSPLFYAAMPDQAKTIFRNRLAVRFAYLDIHLAKHEYLMGENFSVADAHLFVLSNWASWVSFELTSYSNVLAYRGHVGARPAVRAAMNAEGLIPWPCRPP